MLSTTELADFIYMESRVLDDQHYEQWLALFADNGRYWVPLKGAQQSEEEKYNSIADEDMLLLKMRVSRLLDGRSHSQQPPSQGQHVLQMPSLIETNSDRDGANSATVYTLRTPFTYAESRGLDFVTLYGHYVHRLALVDGQLRILLKRVNLVNAHAPLPSIQLFP